MTKPTSGMQRAAHTAGGNLSLGAPPDGSVGLPRGLSVWMGSDGVFFPVPKSVTLHLLSPNRRHWDGIIASKAGCTQIGMAHDFESAFQA